MTEQEIRQALEIARAQAAAYVWGRQDAGESDRDTGYSLDFGNAYAERKRAYLEGRAHYLPNLESAYLDWRRQQTADQQPGPETAAAAAAGGAVMSSREQAAAARQQAFIQAEAAYQARQWRQAAYKALQPLYRYEELASLSDTDLAALQEAESGPEAGPAAP